ncbi:AAA family ATPase [Vibrio sp. EJY3]|uniref:AAA family ATPase n=1 Tax=Vibrio sp. (strain EJY3) TaxID=1116375 RepID=UPI000243BA1D|nr:AAA family ATPase [Vibrio sp. EJY3]AEX21535.1 DNA repair ATPase-like protein [Vibrio sp. EJY3]
MKLIRLEINDFRQFYGKQVVDFSFDDDCGVTLIHGENNGGKTALLNALRWCLYDETTDNLQEPDKLLNKHALNSGKNSFSVNVQVEHDNQLFEIRRVGSHSTRTNNLKVFKIIDGCYSEKTENQPNIFINTILPKEMAQYFFYQGEGTGTLNSQNDFSHIKGAISKVLGLTVAEKTLTHLNRVKSDYQKELTQYDTGNEIEQLLANKAILEAKLSRDTVSLEQKKVDLATAEKEHEEQITQLARFDKSAIEDKLKLRSYNEGLLTSYQREHHNLVNKKLKSVSSWIHQSYGRKLGSVDLSVVDTQELNTTHRYSVDKQLIKDILENSECICGCTIEENSSAAKIISELEKSAVDPELKYRWNSAVSLHSRLASYSSPKHDMIKVLNDIDDYSDKIHEVEKNIEEISHTIFEADIDDIKLIEQKKNAVKSKCDQLNREIPNLEREISKTQIDLKDIDIKVNKLSATQPKAKRIRDLIAATNKIVDLYQEAIDSSKKGVDLILLHKMQNLFSRVAFNGYTVKKVSNGGNNDSFTWAIVDKAGTRVAAGNGYQAMLAISFIIALIQFSSERASNKQHLLTPGTIAPFIADSILAFIGPDNGRELVRYIAESVEQSIFMFSQAQWTETHIDQGIRDKIGKEYNLVQHTVLSEEEFKGQYPTRLSIQGKEFDVVRFGSEFDKVTIEEIVLNG